MISLVIPSYSSQYSMTGITKTVVCAILVCAYKRTLAANLGKSSPCSGQQQVIWMGVFHNILCHITVNKTFPSFLVNPKCYDFGSSLLYLSIIVIKIVMFYMEIKSFCLMIFVRNPLVEMKYPMLYIFVKIKKNTLKRLFCMICICIVLECAHIMNNKILISILLFLLFLTVYT